VIHSEQIRKSEKRQLWPRVARIAPGIPNLLAYKRADFPHDFIAGLSVAAVALPVGVAYAQLAGFNPAVGLYASILPLFAYALFGTSRQLIIGPDAAVCALVAAAVAPLAGGDNNLYVSLTEALTFFAGVLCIAASFLRLGGIADFLSKPILVGFLNGVALSIALGQIGKIFGFAILKGGIIPRLIEFVSKIGLTHWPTLAVGLATFGLLVVSPKLLPRMPAALVAMIAAGAAVNLLRLGSMGVKTVGLVPAGLPRLRFPHFSPELLPDLLAEAVGLALISFSSMMLTARSFASKNRYDIDTDREFAALGMANLASAISQSFAVSGADSRTAVNDSAGGRTQVAGLVAAGVVAAVLMFFTEPLQYLPIAALGAVLVNAALSLVDISTLKALYRIDRREFALSILATVGVVAVGAIKAIVVVVLLAIVRFVRLVSRPKIEVLGTVKGFPGFHSIERHENASTVPGLLFFRFNAPIIFFNAPHFKREALAAAEAAGPRLKWFVIDMIPITMIDATGLYAADEVISTLAEQGVVFVAAGRQTEWEEWGKRRPGVGTSAMRRFPTLNAALKAYCRESGLSIATSETGMAQRMIG
jgi:high affinity sulfate transporter 1